MKVVEAVKALKILNEDSAVLEDSKGDEACAGFEGCEGGGGCEGSEGSEDLKTLKILKALCAVNALKAVKVLRVKTAEVHVLRVGLPISIVFLEESNGKILSTGSGKGALFLM